MLKAAGEVDPGGVTAFEDTALRREEKIVESAAAHGLEQAPRIRRHPRSEARLGLPQLQGSRHSPPKFSISDAHAILPGAPRLVSCAPWPVRE
jgi:hypothetical protein